MHIIFIIMGVIAIVFAGIFASEKNWYFVFLMGLAVDLCAFVSMMTLGMKVVEEGAPGNMFSAVFGEWGAGYPVVKGLFIAAYVIGVLIALFGLIKVFELKRRKSSDGKEGKA